MHSYDCTGHIVLEQWFKMLLQARAKADRKIADIRRPFGKHRIWYFGKRCRQVIKRPLNRMLGPLPRIANKLHNWSKNVRILKHQRMDAEYFCLTGQSIGFQFALFFFYLSGQLEDMAM